MTARLQEKSGRFYAVMSYKENGKHKQKWKALGLPAKNNKRKAEQMLDKIKREYEERYALPSGEMLFVTYLKQWLERKKQFVELSTWESYKAHVDVHIVPYFEPLNLTLHMITPAHIKDFYDYKYTNGRKDGNPGGLSISTVKKYGVVIKEALTEAVVAGHIFRNPALGVKLPAKIQQSTVAKFLNVEEANRMLAAFKGHDFYPLVLTTVYYGLRRSEVLGLKWSAVDFENNKLSINHTVVRASSVIRKDKTKTPESRRTFSLIDDVKQALLEHKAKQDKYKEAFGGQYKNNDYIFTWADGTPYNPEHITSTFQRVMKNNNLPHMRFHDLRHTTASILYDKGWDMKDIQLWLRHSSINVTADIYTHISENRKSTMANELNSTFQF